MSGRGKFSLLIIYVILLAIVFLLVFLPIPNQPLVVTEITIESPRANEKYLLAFQEAIRTRRLTLGKFLVKDHTSGEEYLVPVRVFVEAQIKYYKSFITTGQVKEEYFWTETYNEDLTELQNLIDRWKDSSLLSEYFANIYKVSADLHNCLTRNLCLEIGGGNLK